VLRAKIRRSASPRARVSWSLRALSPVGVGCAVLLLTAGCGLIGSSAASSPSSAGSASSGAGAFYSCLRQHGVTIPAARPTSGSGGFAGGGSGGSAGGSAAFAKARQACASLRPSGGFGGGFGAALAAFRSCMSSHGETIPSARPTAPPSPGSSGPDRFLNGLNPGNAKVAAALKACQPKLPSFGSGS
jgi:hypothetical protein